MSGNRRPVLRTSDDIAAAAVYLAEDECFMTGENLQVSGGLTLRRNPNREEIAASVEAAITAAERITASCRG